MIQTILVATLMRPQGETGVQTHFRTFMAYLHENRRKCDLITPYNATLWQVYPVFGLRKLLKGEISVWWYRYWHAYFLRSSLKKQLKSGSECIIYAQCPLSAEAAIKARVNDKQKVVMVVHFNISQADEWAEKRSISYGGRLYKRIQNNETAVLPQLDGLVFVSKFMQQQLIIRIPELKKLNSAIVPNFLPDPGLPANKQPFTADLISIGTLETRKNQKYLLEIIAELRKQGSPLMLTLIGDGPDKSMLQNKARELKIEDLVQFAGFVNNAAEQISLHKACIHVATIENLPLTLIEAIARGRPIFAAPVGGIPEILSDGIAGLSIPLDDAKAAARIVADAINNGQWMDNTGLEGRKHFLKNYINEVAAKKLTEFLDSVFLETISSETAKSNQIKLN